ncbi:MAG: hypothetical protein ACI4XP_00510 [Acutalibacteraceae bacterium]
MTINELMIELDERIRQKKEDLDYNHDKRYSDTNLNRGELNAYLSIKELLEDDDTRDGECIEEDNDIICSVCDTHFNVFDNRTETFRFCPHCGAKME